MKTLRTPDDRFRNLPDYPFDANYVEVTDGEGGSLRIHSVDEGPKNGDPVLLMHGEPSWSYLYRKMIPIILNAGHMDWMQSWLEKMGLSKITLVCQDWGGLIGLRLVAHNPDLFARVVVANTGLPTGDTPMSDAFLSWRKFSLEVPDFDVGAIISMGCQKPVPQDIVSAYNAPFPDDTYKEGARIFPSLVPIEPNDPASAENRKAWEVLSRFDKPFLTAFSDGDPITRGGEKIFKKRVPGAKDQPHTIIKGGGHFLQEDCAAEFAEVVVDFMSRT